MTRTGVTRTGAPTTTGRGRFTDEFLDPMRALGDEPTDDAMAEVLSLHGTDRVHAILHSIVRDGDPDPSTIPAHLADHLAATLDFPEDPPIDWDRIERAQHFFSQWGLQISVCLFCASLPTAYASANGVRVLDVTARLDTDTRRRIMETGQFLMDVMMPGGLAAGAEGRRSIQRVRLIHAAVRCLIASRSAKRRDLWHAEWGRPINQEDLAGTLLSFGYVPAGPLRRLGVDVTDDEAEDYLYCWSVIGRQLGIREELLTTDLTEAGQLVEAIRARQMAGSEEGLRMASALVGLLEEMTPTRRADVIIPVLIRRLAGDDVADILGIPALTFRQRLLGWLFSVAGTIESVAGRDVVLGRYVERVARDLLEGVFLLERGGERPALAIPEALRIEWEVETTS